MKDLSETRIPNLLIVSGLLSGIFYRVLWLQERNYLILFIGIFLPILLFFPLFLLRAMGAGDIKLMAVTGAFFTIRENAKCIVVAILIAGCIALGKVLFYKEFRSRLRYMLLFARNAFQCAVMGNLYEVPYISMKDDTQVKQAGIKFSFPILLSAIIVIGGKV